MGFCSFCGSELNDSDDGPGFPHSLGGMRTLALGHIDGHSKKNFGQAMLRVIPPFLTGCGRRIYAAIFSFWAGVMPPMPMFVRSLL